MSEQQASMVTGMRNHYGLVMEEMQLQSSIQRLYKLLDSYGPALKPQWLEDELAMQQRQLHSLRKVCAQ